MKHSLPRALPVRRPQGRPAWVLALLLAVLGSACSAAPVRPGPTSAGTPSAEPVRGVVTSSLTGRGLHARAGSVATAADGTVTLTGPLAGSTLTVTAPLYQSASVTVGADGTFSVQLQPASASPAAAVGSVPGYQFIEHSGGPSQIAAQLASDPVLSAAKPVVTSGSMSQSGAPVAGIIVATLPAPAALDRVVSGQILADASAYPGGIADGGTASLTLGGIEVRYSQSRQGEADLAWQQASTFFIVDGPASQRPRLESLVSAIIAANS